MIQHVYENTARARSVSRVLVATDDERILDAVRHFGGEAVLTATSHRSGTDRIAEVARDLREDLIVNVQGDLPFLDEDMVEAAVQPMLQDEDLPMATLKTVLRSAAERDDPNVVKVVTDRAGNALYFSRSPIPFRRDAAGAVPPLFRHIGLYAYRRDFLLRFSQLPPTPLEQAESLEQLRALEWGYRIRVTEVEADVIEVDTPGDLDRARVRLGAAGRGGSAA